MQDLLHDFITEQIKKDLEKVYGSSSSNLIDFWNETQVRESESIEEVEDVFFWEILE
jgi:hypothetical protein